MQWKASLSEIVYYQMRERKPVQYLATLRKSLKIKTPFHLPKYYLKTEEAYVLEPLLTLTESIMSNFHQIRSQFPSAICLQVHLKPTLL